jgi:hypothetical protein
LTENKLASRSVAEIDELFEIMEAVLSIFIIEMIASVFPTGSKDENKLLIWMMMSNMDSNKCKSITLVKFLIG